MRASVWRVASAGVSATRVGMRTTVVGSPGWAATAKPKPLQPHVSQDIEKTDDPFNPPAPESYKNPSALY